MLSRSHIEGIFRRRPLPGDFNIDELALELEDAWPYQGRANGSVSEEEADAVRPLNEFLLNWSGRENEDFWTIDALFKALRWAEVRRLASLALSHLPDQERVIGDGS